MRILEHKLFRYCAIAACATIVANGCVLDRSPIRAPWGDVSPREYCAGDTLQASYQFFDGACPAGADCTLYTPNVTISSMPSLFPSTPFNAYRGSVDFPASGDSVAVTFDIDRDAVSQPMEGGLRQITGISDLTITASRITGSREFTQTHAGMCAGSLPVNAPAELPTRPRFSQNLQLRRLCNDSGVQVTATLSGGAPGVTYSQMLTPGDCIDTSMPGVPAEIAASRVVDVRPLFFDPSVRCSATGPNSPPATLRTRAIMSCP
ncbi:MAG: hypothetical protein JNM58_07805 [Xanthomonadaceae bacterium]|nr:hypothetical protein [Xanthomonadaceae bacterium]